MEAFRKVICEAEETGLFGQPKTGFLIRTTDILRTTSLCDKVPIRTHKPSRAADGPFDALLDHVLPHFARTGPAQTGRRARHEHKSLDPTGGSIVDECIHVLIGLRHGGHDHVYSSDHMASGEGVREWVGIRVSIRPVKPHGRAVSTIRVRSRRVSAARSKKERDFGFSAQTSDALGSLGISAAGE